MKTQNISLATAVALFLSSNLFASTLDERLTKLESEVEKLKSQNEALTEELASIESEKWYASVDVTKSQAGMGSAASKVYYSENPLSIGGYGEFYYSDPNGIKNASSGENVPYTDTYRFIPYIGYKFSDNIILNSEIEFEHGNEVKIEFIYLDFLLNEYANIRLGQQLIPMGLVNLRHEPTLFPTVLRPDVETYLIPSTWNEMGVLLYGKAGDFEYQAALVNALNANNVDTQSGSLKWIKSAKNGTAKNTAMESLAAITRLDYTGLDGAKIGASLYYSPDASNVKTGDVDATSMFMYEAHVAYKKNSLFFNALYTQTKLSGAKNISQNAPKDAYGMYANIGYNFLKPLHMSLPIFAQYEQYNYKKSAVSGSSAKDIKNYTVGLNYFPHEQVVLKAEYKVVDDPNKQDTTYNVVSLGAGFIF